MFGRSHSSCSLSLVSLVLAGLLVGLRQSTDAVVASPEGTRFGFPLELVEFTPDPANPLFTGAGDGHWDVKIRERGWVMREGDAWHLWYTGYDGTREGIKQLGYATSPDGIHWNRYADEPLLKDVWVEDMTVVKRGDTYYMFAEGKGDRARLAHLDRSSSLATTRYAGRSANHRRAAFPWAVRHSDGLVRERYLVSLLRAHGRGDLAGHVAGPQAVDQRAGRAADRARPGRARPAHDRDQSGDQARRGVLWVLPWDGEAQVGMEHQRGALGGFDSLGEVSRQSDRCAASRAARCCETARVGGCIRRMKPWTCFIRKRNEHARAGLQSRFAEYRSSAAGEAACSSQGETIAASSLAELAGGKGLNQSVAVPVRAGAAVVHLGKMAADGVAGCWRQAGRGGG